MEFKEFMTVSVTGTPETTFATRPSTIIVSLWSYVHLSVQIEIGISSSNNCFAITLESSSPQSGHDS